MAIASDAIIEWHLTNNHWPAVPVSLVPVCALAIERAKLDEWDAVLMLPDGVTYRGMATVTAATIIDSFHLQDFVEIDDDDEETATDISDDARTMSS